MNNDNTTIPLAILVLNDLLHSHAIDKDIYDAALAQIRSSKKDKQAA